MMRVRLYRTISLSVLKVETSNKSLQCIEATLASRIVRQVTRMGQNNKRFQMIQFRSLYHLSILYPRIGTAMIKMTQINKVKSLMNHQLINRRRIHKAL